MPARVIFLTREDARALAAVLAGAVAESNGQVERHETIVGDLQSHIDYGAAKTALAAIRRGVESAVVGVWPALTEAERSTARLCWEVHAFARPEIGDGQYERVRQQLAGLVVCDT